MRVLNSYDICYKSPDILLPPLKTFELHNSDLHVSPVPRHVASLPEAPPDHTKAWRCQFLLTESALSLSNQNQEIFHKSGSEDDPPIFDTPVILFERSGDI